jgi:hypothetical protein
LGIEHIGPAASAACAALALFQLRRAALALHPAQLRLRRHFDAQPVVIGLVDFADGVGRAGG